MMTRHNNSHANQRAPRASPHTTIHRAQRPWHRAHADDVNRLPPLHHDPPMATTLRHHHHDRHWGHPEHTPLPPWARDSPSITQKSPTPALRGRRNLPAMTATTRRRHGEGDRSTPSASPSTTLHWAAMPRCHAQAHDVDRARRRTDDSNDGASRRRQRRWRIATTTATMAHRDDDSHARHMQGPQQHPLHHPINRPTAQAPRQSTDANRAKHVHRARQ